MFVSNKKEGKGIDGINLNLEDPSKISGTGGSSSMEIAKKDPNKNVQLVYETNP